MKWSENRQHSRKRVQNNDSEDDPGSWGENGEDANNVYQILRRTTEHTEMRNILKGINSRIIELEELITD